jgi:membrane protease YdiL (CAAX protease family)
VTGRRLALFLIVTFAITWGAWAPLIPAARAGTLRFPDPLFLVLLFLGGFGPAIGAYLAVFATRARAPVAEFHSRLFRWRLPARWYLAAFAIPVGLALVGILIANLVEPGFAGTLQLMPWFLFVPLLLLMVVGGGVEELGWRGVAQPELERQLGPAAAALVVGVIWSIWHLPLFRLRGVGQYNTDFATFAVGAIGGACILGWLYHRTNSILLCVTLHATWNAVAEMGLSLPQTGSLAMVDAGVRLVAGLALITTALPRVRPTDAAARSAPLTP